MKKVLAGVLVTVAIALAAELLPAVGQTAQSSSAASKTMETSGASSQPEGGANKDWTVDDVIMAERADSFRISPDNQWVVWVKHTVDTDKDGGISNLFLSGLTEKKEIELTRGTDTTSSPKWSRDGRLIAFISSRPLPKPPKDLPGKPSPTQIWLINPFGGEPWPLTHSERGVKDFDWLSGDTILVAAEEDPSLYERKLEEGKDNSRVVDDALHTAPVRLFKVDVKTGQVTRLAHNDDWIDGLEVSPDGRKVVVRHARSLSYEFDQKVPPIAILRDLQTGEEKRLFTDGKILPGRVRWAPSSDGFYITSEYSSDPVYRTATVQQLYYYDLAKDQAARVDLGWENELGGGFAVTPDGFVALLAAGSRYKAARYTRQGESWTRAWVEGEHANNLFALELGKDAQTLVYHSSTASHPGQWYRAKLQGASIINAVSLTELNPGFAKKTAAKSEVIHWKGALDEEVEGVLYYPQKYQAGKKYPLVVMIHGGPAGADMDEWSQSWAYPVNLYTQRGAFVFRPNYHGSGNYGLKWVESIGHGKYYDLEVPDIEKGVDDLIARGLAEPEKLGVLGWSNGGILTDALVVTNTRFKAASAGAADVEWISDWSNVVFGASFDNYYFGKAPIDDPELYIRKSPLFKMKGVQTPLLLFHGTEDFQVPPSQSWEAFRNLQQLGKTVKYVIFPGEPHGPQKLSHQRRKVEEELAWFDRYLFKPSEGLNEAFKDDSPLGQQLKRSTIKRAGLRYGLEVKSVLVPETVKYQGLEIGRFEVTRAQYAAFDKNYKVDPGTENYPANGITFENAQAYCAWLAKTTGEAYRLGAEAEMEAIYKSAKGGENTLDYWAGYSPNPEDTARLQSKIKELGGGAPLLREVGSFRGVGEGELVFDLGGNVAEWVVSKDGHGRILGGSADRPADGKQLEAAPDPAYVGFRVVKGPKT